MQEMRGLYDHCVCYRMLIVINRCASLLEKILEPKLKHLLHFNIVCLMMTIATFSLFLSLSNISHGDHIIHLCYGND